MNDSPKTSVYVAFTEVNILGTFKCKINVVGNLWILNINIFSGFFPLSAQFNSSLKYRPSQNSGDLSVKCYICDPRAEVTPEIFITFSFFVLNLSVWEVAVFVLLCQMSLRQHVLIFTHVVCLNNLLIKLLSRILWTYHINCVLLLYTWLFLSFGYCGYI